MELGIKGFLLLKEGEEGKERGVARGTGGKKEGQLQGVLLQGLKGG